MIKARLGAVLLSALVFALPAGITLTLKHQGEQAIAAKVHLQAALTELRIQDALEWRAISDRVPFADVRQELSAARRRGSNQLSKAGSLGLSSAAVDRIVQLSTSYSQAVDEEVRLLSLGQQEQALRFDEDQVDPAFQRILPVVENAGQELERDAQRAQSLSDFGVLLTVLLFLTLVSVVQSRRRRAEVRDQTKRQGEARYRSLINQSSDLVLVVDRGGLASFLSPSAERLFASLSAVPGARQRADVLPVNLISAVDPQDQARLSAALQTSDPGRETDLEVQLTGPQGVLTFALSIQDLTTEPSVGGLVVTAHDITDRLALQGEMEHRALHDPLTGLPNRTLLNDRIEQSLRADVRAGSSTGLLLLDLDRFKQINDTFGHHHGDEVLIQVGPRLARVLRDGDTVARLAGDEFVVLLPNAGVAADLNVIAAKLQAVLEVPFHVEGVELDVEVSIGVVRSGEDGLDASTLLQRADVAMYAAKTQNLGVSLYDAAADGHSPARLALFGDLRRALERGELILLYQPKVCIQTGDVVGVEALVRWEHPERGLVLPDEFIPFTEHTGLIGPLTHHVLDVALAQARQWCDAGRPLPVSVNLSARNLLDVGLPAQVAELLAARGVAPELLHLEVTESAIMTEPVRAQQILEQLAALGVLLSIDDFGAGYTSLSQLKNLPVSELKIDKSFVMTMTEDHSNALIVRSVVDLGHNLGYTLVAEGVETEQALTALAGLGCDVAQGYHLSRPITAAAFDTWRSERAPSRLTANHV
ncbi:MAG: EAL domain-containing protein [Dermatophilaceae bacterium]